MDEQRGIGKYLGLAVIEAHASFLRDCGFAAERRAGWGRYRILIDAPPGATAWLEYEAIDGPMEAYDGSTRIEGEAKLVVSAGTAELAGEARRQIAEMLKPCYERAEAERRRARR